MANLARGTAQCTFDTGETYGTVTPSYDTAIRNSPYSDCVMNAGNKFQMSYTSSSLLVSFTSGSIAKVGGCYWALKSATNITLQSNSTVYVCLEINKANQDGSKADIVLKTLAQISHGDLYGNDNVRDYPIYKVTTNSSGVSSIEDLRFIISDTNVESETAYDSLTKRNYSIYDIYED